MLDEDCFERMAHDRGPDVPRREGAIIEGNEVGSLPNLGLVPKELEVRKLWGRAFPSTTRGCCQWPAEPESDRVLGCWY